MMKTVMITKFRRGRQGRSARNLRRAIGRSRVKIGRRVGLLLIAFLLVVGAIGIFVNMKIEQLEKEHHTAPERRGRP
jgi:hypothetical protein